MLIVVDPTRVARRLRVRGVVQGAFPGARRAMKASSASLNIQSALNASTMDRSRP